MNYIRHLTGFFDRIANDDRLNPTHISLYISLFQFWNVNRFQNPISISRSEMMKVSKICANATYHKVMKDLHNFGFIRYKPSYNPFRGSEVEVIEFDDEQVQAVNSNHTKRGKRNEQALNSHHTKNETSIEPINEPYINNTNIINSKLAYEPTNENSDLHHLGSAEEESSAHLRPGSKELTRGASIPASVEEAKAYFEEQKSTANEAEKFFNYFQSNGWRVGGRAPMKDWQASARNWILNCQKFTVAKKPLLHVSTDKDYAEPL